MVGEVGDGPCAIRVALVEDHDGLRKSIMRRLARSGVMVDAFSHIEPAWFAMLEGGYAAAIVDRRLPDGDGLELVRHLRAAGRRTPCLMLTGRNGVRDRVAGFEAGAADYLAKPFAMEELVARTQALMRRQGGEERPAPAYAGLSLSPDGAYLSCGGRCAKLEPAERAIMRMLLNAHGRAVGRDALERAAGGLLDPFAWDALGGEIRRLQARLAGVAPGVEIAEFEGRTYWLRDAPDDDALSTLASGPLTPVFW